MRSACECKKFCFKLDQRLHGLKFFYFLNVALVRPVLLQVLEQYVRNDVVSRWSQMKYVLLRIG